MNTIQKIGYWWLFIVTLGGSWLFKVMIQKAIEDARANDTVR